MGKSFWDKAQLWEKLLLVLAVGMVCTLIFAVSKLIYGNLRIRKYTKLAEARKAHLENVRSSRQIIQLKGADVPFGIRALESGVEVEGIVISRPSSVASVASRATSPASNRPNQSQLTLVGSDNESLKGRAFGPGNSGFHPPGVQMQQAAGRPLVYQPSPYISLPPKAHNAGSPGSSRSSSASSVASVNRISAVDGPRHARRTFSESSVPTDAITSLSLSNTPDPQTLAKLEGKLPSAGGRRKTANTYPRTLPRAASQTPTPPERSPTLPSVHEGSSEEVSRSSDSSLEESTRPRLMTAYSTPVFSSMPSSYGYATDSVHGDLSLLHTHRLSHAAEVGQLLPRRTRQSRTISGLIIPGSPVVTANSSPQPFHSPADSDPIYALDIALPPPVAPFPGAAPDLRMHPIMASPKDSLADQVGSISRYMEGLWDQQASSSSNREPTSQRGLDLDGSESDIEPSRPEKNERRRLRKSRNSRNINVDLEAQK